MRWSWKYHKWQKGLGFISKLKSLWGYALLTALLTKSEFSSAKL